MQRIMEIKIVGKEPDMIRVASWSELCSDLLEDIIGRLCFADQVRFLAVCKSWHNFYFINKSHAVCKSLGLKNTSWFVRVFRGNQELFCTLQFHLYAPSYSIDDPISVHSISLSELGVPILSSSSSTIRIFCKYSWSFISITKRRVHPYCHRYFILFSPLTKKLKQLPPCLNSSGWNIEHTFSSDPESANCVFLFLDTWSFDDKVVVATCGSDDKEWTVRRFKKVQNFKHCVCVPMYAREIFYIVSPHGQLASYNITENKFKFESLSVDDNLSENYTRLRKCILVMVNGELFYIFGKNKKPGTKRYDRSKKVWIPVSSLRDSAIVNVDEPHSVANMIEFFHSGCQISSLESSDLVPEFILHSGSFKLGQNRLIFLV